MLDKMPDNDEAIKALKLRYAKGEITRQQFKEMKESLQEDAESSETSQKRDVTSARKNESHGKSKLPLVFALIIVILIILYVLSKIGGSPIQITGNPNGQNSGPLPLAPSQVTVSGQATSSGSGTQVTKVIFTDSSGNSYAASVNGGQYSIQLKNPGTYTIIMQWKGQYTWQGGNSTSTTLNLNQGIGGSSTLTDNLNLNTPDSTYSISGNASTKTFGTSAIGLVFNATGYYKEPVSIAGGSGEFSTTLPNGLNYGVYVEWKSAFQTGYCYAGNVTINGASIYQTSWSC